MQEIKLLPGQEWTDATVAWRFVLMRRGAAYWLSAANSRSLAESEMILAAPGVTVTLRASQLGEVVLYSFNFAPDLLCGFFTPAERHFLQTGGLEGFRDVEFIPSTHPAAQQFSRLTESGSRPGSLAQRVGALNLAATVFDQALSRHTAAAMPGTGVSRRFTQLITQMADAELINYSPEQLARLCGCSQRHFSRLFRKRFGVSPRAHQTELRLLRAGQFLRDTESRIAQVACESGYPNLSLFNSLFKKRFGVTPSQYRRNAAITGRQSPQP